MNSWREFFEIFLTLHALLFISSFFISSKILTNRPSLKLKISRILFISCLISPLLLHFLPKKDNYLSLKFIAFELMSESFDNEKNHDSLNPILQNFSFTEKKISLNKEFFNWFLIIVWIIGSIWQIIRIAHDLQKIHSILRSATLFRRCRSVHIKITEKCSIPFSFRFFKTSYIILPLDLLHSSLNTKISIAHEGQHHRQVDCLWVLFVEFMQIFFWINPCFYIWKRSFSELQEQACDEVLVGRQKISAHDYGHCLYHVAQTVSLSNKQKHRIHACTVAMTWGDQDKEQSFLTRRICMLLNYQKTSTKVSFITFLKSIAVFLPFMFSYAAKGSLTSRPALDITPVNAKIQKMAEEEIRAAVTRYQAKSAAVILLDASTHNVLAFAEDKTSRLTNSWKERLFAPGSLIKPFIAAVALEAHLSTEKTTYDCQSPYYIDGVRFTNAEPNIKELTLLEAITKSVNICMIKVAQKVGFERLHNTLTQFGFPINTQKDSLQLAKIAMGTELPITLPSLLKAYEVLANNGISTQNTPIVSKQTADALDHMLMKVISSGTGKKANIENLKVAGKTATLLSDENSSVALFAGYLPHHKSRLVSIVVIEGGLTKDGKPAVAGNTAAPVFREVMIKGLKLLTEATVGSVADSCL